VARSGDHSAAPVPLRLRAAPPPGQRVVAPGAAGKTTLKIGRAICMATGLNKLGHRVWNGPHRVWLWNLEDDLEEVEKIIHAFLKMWDLTAADLGDRLFINGADSINSGSLKLAVEANFGGFKVQRPIAEALIEELTEKRIDYLDIDPFVSSHAVDENSNQAIDAVAKEWLRIAHAANCAVGLAHHLRKTTAAEFTAQDARGAGAMINAARSCLILQRMSKEQALLMQIAECDRKRYFSVYDDKNNKAPPALKAEWYEFEASASAMPTSERRARRTASASSSAGLRPTCSAASPRASSTTSRLSAAQMLDFACDKGFEIDAALQTANGEEVEH
jgi:RecA-family ATPase